MKKWTLRIVGGVLLLVIVILVAVYFYMDSIAKRAVESGGTYAMGVPTTLDSISLGLFSGEVALDDLRVANPQGFESEYFFALGDAEVAVTPTSLWADTVVVPVVHLDDITLNLEKNEQGENYQVILDNLSKLSSGEKPQEDPNAQPKNWVIQDLRVTNINVKADVKGVMADKQTVAFNIPEIQLTDVKSDSMAELQGQVMKQIMSAVIQQGAEQLPGIMLSELQGGIGKIGELGEASVAKIAPIAGEVGKQIGELGQKVGGEVGEKLGDVGGKLGGAAGGAGEKAQEAVGGAVKEVGELGKGIGGLLGGKKDGEKAEEEK